ncbi:MAG: DUF4125 family protein [Actinobacteria bacterium]|jgi:hypothetical protein|nr:MAG: DUF4125 family protein [Actinomycetota bacterium]
MRRKEELISEILDIEWEMFTSVQARGRSASCQEDRQSFHTIRTANFLTWSETTLASYLNDLKMAQAKSRNLMTEKYARMEGLIPPLNPEAEPIIDRIVRKECLWAEEYLKGTPGARLARPIYSRDDTHDITSSETYSRAELETYSTRTLDFYYSDILGMSAQGENRIALAVGYMKAMSSDKDLDWKQLLASLDDHGTAASTPPCS